MNWDRFKQYFFHDESLGFSLDISRMNFPDAYFTSMKSKMTAIFKMMDELEGGAIANPDEKRMVGHYWLRDPELAPNKAVQEEIEITVERILKFAAGVHNGEIKGPFGPFKNLLVVGIGGSALGPQFVSQALGNPGKDKMRVFFFDNTDPDGMDLTLAHLYQQLGQTLVVVITKSGGTPETRNGMLEAEMAFKKAGLVFAKHAVAVTGEGSQMDQRAKKEGWLERFPMWDWVGGRTSELAAVGLLPAALQGIDILQMLEGAKQMDMVTRSKQVKSNPSALLALMWLHATRGIGAKDMVILPYKDRLMLFSKYLQQLVMESLGKEKDLKGNVVHQGIAVYGNKGSTDQHAYVQELRDGVNNFFLTFVEVHKERKSAPVYIEPNTTSGDYLQGFLLGTREALYEKDRESITITVNEVSPFSVGMLIALYERAVGFYGFLVGINAYNQPGVEAGKKAAAGILQVKNALYDYLKSNPNKAFTVDGLAKVLKLKDQEELIYKLIEHMAANPEKGVVKEAQDPFYDSKYTFKGAQ